MCEHCGCRGTEAIAELMDEHLALLDLAGEVRWHLQREDRAGAVATLEKLGDLLLDHVSREENGVFAALKQQGDFAYAVEELEGEHNAFDIKYDELDPESPSFTHDVNAMLDDLVTHIDKENLGVFPVAVVTLRARDWAIVDAARDAAPDAEASLLLA
jgi:iron-sulfur cluster repair protein YtfE (RIC family)